MPDSHSSRKGIAFGYIDDLYWATHFTNMIEIIRFVKERGPEYGYRLNLGKCIYLLSHNPSDRLSVDQKVARILDLGIPNENIKVHPDCEPYAPRELILKRQREYGFKMLGSFVGTDSFVLNALQGKAARVRIFCRLTSSPLASFSGGGSCISCLPLS